MPHDAHHARQRSPPSGLHLRIERHERHEEDFLLERRLRDLPCLVSLEVLVKHVGEFQPLVEGFRDIIPRRCCADLEEQGVEDMEHVGSCDLELRRELGDVLKDFGSLVRDQERRKEDADIHFLREVVEVAPADPFRREDHDAVEEEPHDLNQRLATKLRVQLRERESLCDCTGHARLLGIQSQTEEALQGRGSLVSEPFFRRRFHDAGNRARCSCW
jgi:hypothetical protein